MCHSESAQCATKWQFHQAHSLSKSQKKKKKVSPGGGDADKTEKKSTSSSSYCLRWCSSREGTSVTGECTGCKRKPQRHLSVLCDIIWLVKWLICTLIARECSNHTEVITASTPRCFPAHSPQRQGIPRQSGEASRPPLSGKHRTLLDRLLCLRPLGRSHSVSNAVSHPSVWKRPPLLRRPAAWKMRLHGDGSYPCTYGNMIFLHISEEMEWWMLPACRFPDVSRQLLLNTLANDIQQNVCVWEWVCAHIHTESTDDCLLFGLLQPFA